MKLGYVRAIFGPHKVFYRTINGKIRLPYLQPNLFIDSERSVGERDGITEAADSAYVALCLVYDDLRTFGVGMET